jgi:hypothetical protein
MLYSCEQLSEGIGCTTQTVRNWVSNGWLSPAEIDERGIIRFSEEQYNGIINALPLPKYSAREKWLSQFSCETVDKSEGYVPANPVDKSIVPTGNPNKGGLYQVPNKTEAAQKITNLLEQSNELFIESVTRPKTDIYNPEQLVSSTKEYFDYCREHGIMPSFRRLANWYGYSYNQLYRNINKENETGIFLDRVRDAIKDNLEQAALVNAVNNISAMFILKTQHDYVEATKVVIEPSDKLLGQPKTLEEIESCIDADIIED